jgi:hypothetical protein
MILRVLVSNNDIFRSYDAYYYAYMGDCQEILRIIMRIHAPCSASCLYAAAKELPIFVQRQKTHIVHPNAPQV